MRINLLVFTAIAASSTLLTNPLLAKASPAKQEIAQAPTPQSTTPPASAKTAPQSSTVAQAPQPTTPPTQPPQS
ncbi:hypothetical protein PseudUWO310_19380, partial [Pseudanabaena sp. UWO310]